MFRLVLSLILVVAFAGASAASVIHGLNHGPDRAAHHAEMVEDDPMTHAMQALAECCDATGGMGSVSCVGDLVVASEISPTAPKTTSANWIAPAGCDLSGLIPTVPTGPPKV